MVRNIIILLLLQLPLFTLADIHAEGFGAETLGGKDGKVLFVTTLEDNNDKGSLRWAVAQPFARHIKFKVSGTIHLKNSIDIVHPFVTIDGSDELLNGQSGITIRDYPIDIRTHDVIIQFIRIRLGDVAIKKRVKENNWERHKGSGDLDCLNIHQSHNVLIDHVSMSWSCDEIVSVTNSTNVTIQWCILSEPLLNPKLHPYGDSHAYCSNNSATTLSYHHNLFAHYVIRGPQFEANDIVFEQLPHPKFEAINNVCYAFTKSGMRYSGAFDFPEKYKGKNVKVDFHFIGNKFINTAIPPKSEIECIDNYGWNQPIHVYLKNNMGYHNQNELKQQKKLVFMDGKAHHTITEPKNKLYLQQLSDDPLFTTSTPVKVEHPDSAYAKIVLTAGCYLVRDVHDERVIDDLKNKRTPRILKSQEEVEAL